MDGCFGPMSELAAEKEKGFLVHGLWLSGGVDEETNASPPDGDAVGGAR
jgi:hypothetical protein